MNILTTDHLLHQIDTFLKRSGMSPTEMGKAIANDSALIFDIRNGRSPSLRTVERIMAYIETHQRDTVEG